MKILPVLDLMAGQVVRGIAGRRSEYRPIVSKLTNSTEPLAVARAFWEHFGFDELYLADLDAIQGAPPADAVYDELIMEGFKLWIDCGISSVLSRLGQLRNRPEGRKVHRIIVGLESVLGPDALAAIVRHGTQEIVFSLDLKAGMPLGNLAAWMTDDPWVIATRVIEMGIDRLIVLDLANVGVGEGIGTEALCARLKQTYPKVQLTAGGGVRGMDDVNRLTSLGVDYVLVASALHDGRITRPRP